MIRLKLRKDPLTGDNLLYHAEKDILFTRVCGGVTFPHGGIGFVVVVGEAVSEFHMRGRSDLYWLSEGEATDSAGLIKLAMALGREFMVSEYVSRMTSSQSQFLSFWNKRAREARSRTLSVIDPPFPNEAGHFGYHLQILIQLLEAGNKSLFLDKRSCLAGCLMSLQSSEIEKIKDFDHPQASALSYVVAHLINTQPITRPRQTKAMDEYPILGG